MTDSKLAKQTALPRRRIYRTRELVPGLLGVVAPKSAKKHRKAKKAK